MQLIQPIKCRAFTLVEMLVALAVSSIIIAATYASYEMVATQYKKNMDVADMHTSGRAIMRIIERDVRMAGFEYRDKDAKVTYGTISSPLTIKDSGNKCCDEVTVIYDYFDEDTKKAERLRIRYWAEAYSTNKGARHRLYKQKDILGKDKKILAKPILGKKDVMADYIEDLQIVNIINDGLLYSGYDRGSTIAIHDPVNKKVVGSFNSGTLVSALAFGPNGLLYSGYDRGSTIAIHDPVNKKVVGSFNSGTLVSALAFDPNGLLYSGYDRGSTIAIHDPVNKKVVGSFNSGTLVSALAFDPNGLLYSGYDRGSTIAIHDPVNKKVVGSFNSGTLVSALAFDPNGLLYSGYDRGSTIAIHDPVNKKVVGSFNSGTLVSALAFDPNGLLYSGYDRGSTIAIHDPVNKKVVGSFNSGTLVSALAFKSEKTGQKSLVTINLTLRTKNQYGKDRQFKKKDYHAGNYKLDKTDKYKRDTFSSTVLVRNLAL